MHSIIIPLQLLPAVASWDMRHLQPGCLIEATMFSPLRILKKATLKGELVYHVEWSQVSKSVASNDQDISAIHPQFIDPLVTVEASEFVAKWCGILIFRWEEGVRAATEEKQRVKDETKRLSREKKQREREKKKEAKRAEAAAKGKGHGTRSKCTGKFKSNGKNNEIETIGCSTRVGKVNGPLRAWIATSLPSPAAHALKLRSTSRSPFTPEPSPPRMSNTLAKARALSNESPQPTLATIPRSVNMMAKEVMHQKTYAYLPCIPPS